ncbi:HMG [Caenorhabditis elegans]|uniref:HMG n=1 Tax=Caenorhabditis elegans TaxID=6239 RepID=G5EEL9_CAEEL|nr:HMG [Caenorhabditis elegans]AAC78600.1 high mobility group protein I alpha [Caenorhabditis elegans]CCD69222.1 HMG [Caenorhabditis elegans]|eukprot:NP_494825.1 HMG [Caenorhabditis elegans]
MSGEVGSNECLVSTNEVQEDSPAVTESSSANGSSPVRRGRGRPPKGTKVPKVKPAPKPYSGAPRGRPRKSDQVAKSPVAKSPVASSSADASPKRSRGAPKSYAEDVAATKPAKTDVATPALAALTGEKKGRGRPKKN